MRSFSASSTLVPLAARSASVFFTTRYLRARCCGQLLRSSKSWATVSLLYVATIMLETFFRSCSSFSTCSIFFALVTAMCQSFQISSGGGVMSADPESLSKSARFSAWPHYLMPWPPFRRPSYRSEIPGPMVELR